MRSYATALASTLLALQAYVVGALYVDATRDSELGSPEALVWAAAAPTIAYVALSVAASPARRLRPNGTIFLGAIGFTVTLWDMAVLAIERRI
jgi:hypothetical protein